MAGTTTKTKSTQTKLRDKVMDQHDIPLLGNFYTKAEVDAMVAEAVEEARRIDEASICLLYTSPSPRDRTRSRMPSSA